MEEIKEMKRECIDIGRALFRGLKENRIIVDLHYKDAYIKTVIEDGKKIQKKFPAYKADTEEISNFETSCGSSIFIVGSL